MAEVVGLVLGAIPIAIWALERYQEPFEVYSDYHHIISTLKIKLEIRELQLRETLRLAGLDNPNPAELEACFKQNYPDRCDKLMYIIREMDVLTSSLLENLSVDINKKPGWTDEPPDRASWEWRKVKRCFSTKKRTKMLQDLEGWNMDLKSLIESAEVPAEDSNEATIRVKRAYNGQSCDAIRQSLKSLHGAVRAHMKCDGEMHLASLELCWQKAKTPTYTISILHGLNPDSGSFWRSFSAVGETHKTEPQSLLGLQTTATSPTSASRPRSPFSRLNPRRIFDKPQVSFSSAQDPSLAPPSKLPPTLVMSSSCISNLCAEVHDTQKAGGSIGIIREPDSAIPGRSFAVSHVPEAHPKMVQAIPLKTMLGADPKPDAIATLMLSRRQRYYLAASLSKSVLYLSDSPWLGDLWDNEQVQMFLQQSLAGYDTLSQNPYMSYIFTDSATTSPEPPEDPVSRLIRFGYNKFIFALGIILIELAINQVFHQNSIEAIRNGDWMTVKKNLEKVYLEMGNSYGDAAQRCVKCEFMGCSSRLDFGVPAFRQQFYDAVVAPLQGAYEVFSNM